MTDPNELFLSRSDVRALIIKRGGEWAPFLLAELDNLTNYSGAALAAAQAAGERNRIAAECPDREQMDRIIHENGFAAGIEAAAQWHEGEAERIRNLPQWPENENKMIAAIGEHEEHAESIRALRPPAGG